MQAKDMIDNKRVSLDAQGRKCISGEILNKIGGMEKSIYGINFAGSVFEEGCITGFSFINCDFNRAGIGMKFEKCLFSGCDFRDAELNSVFSNCEIRISSLDKAMLGEKCDFLFCRMQMCSFRESMFRKCCFYCCELSYCDFYHAVFEEPEVERCRCRVLWNLVSPNSLFSENAGVEVITGK